MPDCQSQTFCGKQNDDLHSVKLFFVPKKTEEVLNCKCSQIFGLAQKIWTGTHIFGPVKDKALVTFFFDSTFTNNVGHVWFPFRNFFGEGKVRNL